MQPNSTAGIKLNSPKVTAARLGISESTLAKWRLTGAVRLPYVKIGARVAYTDEAIENFIVERTRETTSEYRPQLKINVRRRGRPCKVKTAASA